MPDTYRPIIKVDVAPFKPQYFTGTHASVVGEQYRHTVFMAHRISLEYVSKLIRRDDGALCHLARS